MAMAVSRRVAFYLPLGYPDWDTFYGVLDVLEAAGVGWLELGLPVSDPFMDGDVIASAHGALLGSVDSDDVHRTLVRIRRDYSFRVVLMTYAEGVGTYGLQRLPRWTHDAVLCVDEELEEASHPGLIHVFTEETTGPEMRRLLARSSHFAYVASGPGGTGGSVGASYVATIARIRAVSSIPVFVGFGIRSGDDIRRVLGDGADGVAIGSELLRRLDAGGVSSVQALVHSLGLDQVVDVRPSGLADMPTSP